MIAASQIFLGRGGKSGWVNPYVTDGLVAMWDGEWNAGIGKHNPDATTWVDLSGDGHVLTMPSSSAYEIVANAIKFNGRGAATGASSTDLLAIMNGTVEAVAQRSIGAVDATTRAFVKILQENVNSVYWRGLGTNQGGPIGTTAYSSPYGGYKMTCIPSVETVDRPIAASFTYDQSFDNPVIDCFANGVLSGKTYIYNFHKTAPTFATPVIGTTSTYDGLTTVYCVRLYSRALTAAEIAANYAIDKARFNLP